MVKIKFCLVESTGELESLLLFFLMPTNEKVYVFDITAKNFRGKNLYLYTKFSHLKPFFISRPLSRILKALIILLPYSYISINCVNNFLFKFKILKKYLETNHIFFRDSLTPHFNSLPFGTSTENLTLICEQDFQSYYNSRSYLNLDPDSIKKFLDIVLKKDLPREKKLLVISKNYGRNINSLENKRLFFETLKNSVNKRQIVVCPHPRESELELNIYRNLKIPIFFGNIYEIVDSAEIIINLGTSSVAYPLYILGYSFYSFFDKDEFSKISEVEDGRWNHLTHHNYTDLEHFSMELKAITH